LTINWSYPANPALSNLLIAPIMRVATPSQAEIEINATRLMADFIPLIVSYQLAGNSIARSTCKQTT